MRILLSRTDSIGDVVLTLPMAGIIKAFVPKAHIAFLGTTYTEEIVKCCPSIDDFINWDKLSAMNQKEAIDIIKEHEFDACVHVFPRVEVARMIKKADVRMKIGTYGRTFHWNNCNHLVRFSRKKSELHEAQLNIKLLRPLGIEQEFSLPELSSFAKFTNIPELPQRHKTLLAADKFNLILHPKSKGSAIEWGVENFAELIRILPQEKFKIFISGTEADKQAIGNAFADVEDRFTNIQGSLSLKELIAFIANAKGLIAASTGPLHIAGILNKVAIGLFSSRRPIHPGRWAPLGSHSKTLVFDEKCPTCAQGKNCNCIQNIAPEKVRDELYILSDLAS